MESLHIYEVEQNSLDDSTAHGFNCWRIKLTIKSFPTADAVQGCQSKVFQLLMLFRVARLFLGTTYQTVKIYRMTTKFTK
jgi:hypothetical protein